MVDQEKGQTHNVEFTTCASVAAERLHSKTKTRLNSGTLCDKNEKENLHLFRHNVLFSGLQLCCSWKMLFRVRQRSLTNNSIFVNFDPSAHSFILCLQWLIDSINCFARYYILPTSYTFRNDAVSHLTNKPAFGRKHV